LNVSTCRCHLHLLRYASTRGDVQHTRTLYAPASLYPVVALRCSAAFAQTLAGPYYAPTSLFGRATTLVDRASAGSVHLVYLYPSFVCLNSAVSVRPGRRRLCLRAAGVVPRRRPLNRMLCLAGAHATCCRATAFHVSARLVLVNTGRRQRLALCSPPHLPPACPDHTPRPPTCLPHTCPPPPAPAHYTPAYSTHYYLRDTHRLPCGRTCLAGVPRWRGHRTRGLFTNSTRQHCY